MPATVIRAGSRGLTLWEHVERVRAPPGRVPIAQRKRARILALGGNTFGWFSTSRIAPGRRLRLEHWPRSDRRSSVTATKSRTRTRRSSPVRQRTVRHRSHNTSERTPFHGRAGCRGLSPKTIRSRVRTPPDPRDP